jgi:hypothetical protein
LPPIGKTVLASFIIEECQKVPNSETIFFYCDQDDPTRNNSISVVRSLLSQSVKGTEDLVEHCHERLRKNVEVVLQSPNIAEELLESFFEIITQTEIIDQNREPVLKRQYVIIDGLDECRNDDWRNIILLFQKIIHNLDKKTNNVRLRVLFVSQYTPQLKKELKTATSIAMTATDNKGDIETYVEKKVGELQEKFDLDQDDRKLVVDETCRLAAGKQRI